MIRVRRPKCICVRSYYCREGDKPKKMKLLYILDECDVKTDARVYEQDAFSVPLFEEFLTLRPRPVVEPVPCVAFQATAPSASMPYVSSRVESVNASALPLCFPELPPAIYAGCQRSFERLSEVRIRPARDLVTPPISAVRRRRPCVRKE